MRIIVKDISKMQDVNRANLVVELNKPGIRNVIGSRGIAQEVLQYTMGKVVLFDGTPEKYKKSPLKISDYYFPDFIDNKLVHPHTDEKYPLPDDKTYILEVEPNSTYPANPPTYITRRSLFLRDNGSMQLIHDTDFIRDEYDDFYDMI